MLRLKLELTFTKAVRSLGCSWNLWFERMFITLTTGIHVYDGGYWSNNLGEIELHEPWF
jgi:hypothetical protein